MPTGRSRRKRHMVAIGRRNDPALRKLACCTYVIPVFDELYVDTDARVQQHKRSHAACTHPNSAVHAAPCRHGWVITTANYQPHTLRTTNTAEASNALYVGTYADVQTQTCRVHSPHPTCVHAARCRNCCTTYNTQYSPTGTARHEQEVVSVLVKPRVTYLSTASQQQPR